MSHPAWEAGQRDLRRKSWRKLMFESTQIVRKIDYLQSNIFFHHEGLEEHEGEKRMNKQLGLRLRNHNLNKKIQTLYKNISSCSSCTSWFKYTEHHEVLDQAMSQ